MINKTHPRHIAEPSARVLLALALLIATACIDTGTKAGVSDSTNSHAKPSISTAPVNQGTYGMTSRVKWVMPPDSSAILVVVDPAGEPLQVFLDSLEHDCQIHDDSTMTSQMASVKCQSDIPVLRPGC